MSQEKPFTILLLGAGGTGKTTWLDKIISSFDLFALKNSSAEQKPAASNPTELGKPETRELVVRTDTDSKIYVNITDVKQDRFFPGNTVVGGFGMKFDGVIVFHASTTNYADAAIPVIIKENPSVQIVHVFSFIDVGAIAPTNLKYTQNLIRISGLTGHNVNHPLRALINGMLFSYSKDGIAGNGVKEITSVRLCTRTRTPSQLEQVLVQKEDPIDALHAEIKHLRAENSKLQEELLAANNDKRNFQADFESEKRAFKMHDATLATAQKELASTKQELASAQKELAAARNELAGAQASEKEISRLGKEVSRLEKLVPELLAINKKLEDELSQTKKIMKTLENQNRQFEASICEAEKKAEGQISMPKATFDKIVVYSDEIKASLEDMCDQVKQADYECNDSECDEARVLSRLLCNAVASITK